MGPSGFPWGGRILYFWPRGEEAERALAQGLATLIRESLLNQLGGPHGDNLCFNAFFLASALQRPEELYETLTQFPRELLPEVDVDLDPWVDDHRYFLDKAIENNAPNVLKP